MISTIKPFAELTLDELHEILALRCEVFIVEQQCVYLDVDGRDKQAHHLLIHEHHKLIGYARILPFDEESMSFGRLLTAPSYRSKGLGKQLMETILSYLQLHHPKQVITITAQQYLQAFYEGFGFITKSAPFDMDGIPHLIMVKQP
ncbi:MAG: GNAT family N-acetyltransferase [Tatlockia sp.]|nr:GNAT family N-acetyltransferase [Tatlockia sp.]